MSGAALLRLGLVFAAVLPGAGGAALAGSGKTPPPAAQAPSKPRVAATLPDLYVTRVFVGTLDASTNTYVALPPEGVAAGQQFRLACFFANRGADYGGSFRVRHLLDGREVAVSNPITGLAHGASSSRGILFTYRTAGSHRYDCAVECVDPGAELVTENNKLGTVFLVHAPAKMTPRERAGPNLPAGPVRAPRVSNVDLTVPQIFARDGFWSVDWQLIGEAVITVTVKNVGMEAAPSQEWHWQWVVDGVPRGCAAADPRIRRDVESPARFGLQPGEGRAIAFRFSGVSDDDLAHLALGFVKTYRVKVRFNCDFAQPERDGGDNESREIPVWFKARKGVPGTP